MFNKLVYNDIFDYPLTSQELGSKEGLMTLGFHHLPGRENSVTTRLERYVIADKKFKIAARAARLIAWIPSIKFIAVCNTLANNNAKVDSDIDFFIGVEEGKIYITRFWVTLILSIFRLRRHGQKISDRVCLSFYLTPSAYNLEKVKIVEDDLHLANWISTMLPIYGQDEFDKFSSENTWIKKYLPNYQAKFTSSRRRIKSFKFGTMFGEKVAKKMQYYKFATNMDTAALARDSRVVISDSMLKFHELDRRIQYRDEYYKRLNEIGQN